MTETSNSLWTRLTSISSIQLYASGTETGKSAAVGAVATAVFAILTSVCGVMPPSVNSETQPESSTSVTGPAKELVMLTHPYRCSSVL